MNASLSNTMARHNSTSFSSFTSILHPSGGGNLAQNTSPNQEGSVAGKRNKLFI